MRYAKHATKIAASPETAKQKMLKDVKIPEIEDTVYPFRYSLGVLPVCCLKYLLNAARLEKLRSSAICSMVLPEKRISRDASAMVYDAIHSAALFPLTSLMISEKYFGVRDSLSA